GGWTSPYCPGPHAKTNLLMLLVAVVTVGLDCWTASVFEVKVEPPLHLKSCARSLRHAAQLGPNVPVAGTGHVLGRAKVASVLWTVMPPVPWVLGSMHLIMATFNVGPGCATTFAAGSAIRTARNRSKLFRIVRPPSVSG